MTTADVSVRVAWADDAPAIAQLQLRTWPEMYAGVVPPEAFPSGPEAVEQAAALWHASLTRPADARHRALVALEHNRVVGFAVTGPASDPDCDPVADAELAELTVDPAERGRGHGSRLLQAAADTMRADRFGRAVLWAVAADDGLRRFLTDAGWATDGAHRELGLDDGGATTVKQVRLHTSLG
ncbi:GNAT family N-acetyltransferase [Nocardioides sp. zg-579]|uniref:GNAT family N-acetyltransferase n=1 Tax=Nocardioides marmotae TaxID=2663857 RepID=A0A6I3JBL7_9ACTN|nr:GNAT family N-acetyltransferase [Nocardioides marmotae]MCR6031854.1 GNAT family N-acetyltransferase [Gordonia jinghuaiqii]MTB95495.1 GNAT family N-acetyltransferase [Nocardioides marmotae]QKE00926.1 GNAT family N-acetyltransferase [Nocardioides marmotae]